MDEAALLRYQRQIFLPSFDVEGQRRLLDAQALIVGLGGLGCPAAMHLAAAGVGALTLADGDCVELSNLHRQLAYREDDCGQPKSAALARTLAERNAGVRTRPLHRRLDGAPLRAAVSQVDVVLDASDNAETRFAINAACLAERKPWVSGAAIACQGQLASFDPRAPDSPCYRCLYREGARAPQRCSEQGVLGPVPGVIGALQAVEAIKFLSAYGTPMVGRLLLFDGLAMAWRSLVLPRDPACPACARR